MQCSRDVAYSFRPSLLRSNWPIFKMFSSPSSATVTIRGSWNCRRSHSGLMQPCVTRYLICAGVPPDVAFEMAHAASFLMSNSAVCSSSSSGGMMLQSIT